MNPDDMGGGTSTCNRPTTSTTSRWTTDGYFSVVLSAERARRAMTGDWWELEPAPAAADAPLLVRLDQRGRCAGGDRTPRCRRRC